MRGGESDDEIECMRRVVSFWLRKWLWAIVKRELLAIFPVLISLICGGDLSTMIL